MIRIRSAIALMTVVALAVLVSGCEGGSNDAGGPTEIVVWNGFTDASATNFASLIDQYNKDHPNIRVTQLMTNNDLVLQKVLTAVRGGSPPDIAYMYGSSSPNIAEIPKLTDLSGYVSQPDWNWDDFYPAERAAATVGKKIVGVPALVDNLAVVYNKSLFAAAGIAPPTKDWTWDDFRATAAKLTNPDNGQYGTLISGDASEDTVWHYLPMLWGAGGDILTPDNQHAAFDSAAGVKALTTLQQMAVTDKSIYVDTTNANGVNLMNSGKIGMLVTGPWDLPSLTDIEYGVQVLPAYPGAAHQTISGPDNWVVFDNGDQRRTAALDFVKWLTAAPQVKATSSATGELPTRASVGQDPALVSELTRKVPGTETFIDNLSNVTKSRPSVPQYPAISQALGQAIVSVLLGTAQPAEALATAAQAADAALAGK